MLFDRPEKRPEVLSAKTLGIALAIHLAFFVVFWLFAVFHGLFDKKEEIIPIDLTVVVNENLDGVENEPPPVKNPDPPEEKKPEPPKPKEKPAVKEPEKPKELERIVTNIVAKVDKKETKKPEKKKVEKKEPEKPKKTKAELRKERLEKMRKSATVNNKPVKIEVKNARESGNGRTEKKTLSDAEIMKLLNQGYRPGTKTQLAPNMMSHCLSLVQRALDEKWNSLLPSVGSSGTVLLSVRFTSNGGLTDVRLSKSCGDKTSDAAALSVARGVSSIPGLDPEFLVRFRKEALTIRYKVQGQ